MRIVKRVALGLALLVTVAAGGTAAWGATHGYRVYIVHTGSMVPTLQFGDIVVDRPAHLPVRKGEIITFRYNSGPDSVITHRAVSDTAAGIRTKGDANPTRDPWTLRPDQVVGTPMAIVPGVGYVLYYLKQPSGAASVATVVLGIWLLWDLCFGSTVEEATDTETTPAPPRRRHGRRRLLGSMSTKSAGGRGETGVSASGRDYLRRKGRTGLARSAATTAEALVSAVAEPDSPTPPEQRTQPAKSEDPGTAQPAVVNEALGPTATRPYTAHQHAANEKTAAVAPPRETVEAGAGQR